VRTAGILKVLHECDEKHAPPALRMRVIVPASNELAETTMAITQKEKGRVFAALHRVRCS
jgi:hypothetical protein